jgi:hypothetical protein
VSVPLGRKRWIDCSFHLAGDDGGEILRAGPFHLTLSSPLVVTIENKEKRRIEEGRWKACSVLGNRDAFIIRRSLKTMKLVSAIALSPFLLWQRLNLDVRYVHFHRDCLSAP